MLPHVTSHSWHRLLDRQELRRGSGGRQPYSYRGGRASGPSVQQPQPVSSFPASEALSLSLWYSGAAARILPSSAAARGQIVVTLSPVVDVVIRREWNIESVFFGGITSERKERAHGSRSCFGLLLFLFPLALEPRQMLPLLEKKKSVQSAKARRGLKKSRDVLRSAPDVFVLQVVPLGEDY